MLIKGNRTSSAADCSPELNFSRVCVDYNSSTKGRVRKWNVASYYFLNFHGRICHPWQSTYTISEYELV